MRIEKWYADCVANDGSVFIGYAGRLKLGPLPLSVHSVMQGEARRPLSQHWAVSAMRRTEDQGAVRWESPRLRLAATWRPAGAPLERVLLASPKLSVTWRCHVPRADARVEVDGRARSGLGYVEELVVEGDPRRLPIEELRWGRFLGERSTVVWIDWKGPHPLTHVFHDGGEVPDASVDDGGVTLGAHRLELGGSDVWTLRDDVVEESIFPSVPVLRKALPDVLARLHETKWAGPGLLRGPGDSAEPGWLLYERVLWP